MSRSHSKVLEWIEQNGYPFELRVAQRCAALGWNVSHGDMFEDVSSGKLRQGDLTAWALRPTPDSKAWARMELAIECKRPTAAPWVAFRSRLRTNEDMLPTLCGRGVLGVFALRQILSRRASFPLVLLADDLIAHTVVQTMGKKEDPDLNPAYAAIRTATSAALASARFLDNAYLEGRPPFFLQITLPVVVVDSELFEYTASDSSGPQLESLRWCAVTCPDATRGAAPAISYVVAGAHVTEFLQQALNEAKLFFDVVLPKLPELTQSLLPEIMKIYGKSVPRSRSLG
jgi:hypothetical protein